MDRAGAPPLRPLHAGDERRGSGGTSDSHRQSGELNSHPSIHIPYASLPFSFLFNFRFLIFQAATKLSVSWCGSMVLHMAIFLPSFLSCSFNK
jgi:hypothetical protein